MRTVSSSKIWRLHFWLPRSMTGLMAASSLVAAVPLVTAVVMAGVALGRLSSLGETLVNDGIMLERLSMSLQTEVQSLNRNVRQYSVVAEPELLKLFDARTERMQSLLQRIGTRGIGAAESERAAVTQARINTANDSIDAISKLFEGLPQVDPPLEEILTRLGRLRVEAEAIAAAASTVIDEQIEALRQARRDAQQVMLLSAVAFAPLTGLLTLGLSLAVSRPLQQMARGATALGHGQYEQPIVIEYPKEMLLLGTKLDWLRQRLARLEADKTQFLRQVSHELKNPLATIREGVDLLRQGTLGPLTSQQLEVAQILDESTSGLDQQIRRLLAFAKWREGKEAQAIWFKTKDLVLEILRAHKPSIMKRALTTTLQIESDTLFGVRNQLRVALENIVVNAIRHAPDASAIEIAAVRWQDQLELSVRDYGPGVPEPDKRRIFEPYVYGDTEVAPSVRGSGLGLSIVDEIVLSHGGVVEVEDAHPGTRFTLAWPVPESAGLGRAA